MKQNILTIYRGTLVTLTIVIGGLIIASPHAIVFNWQTPIFVFLLFVPTIISVLWTRGLRNQLIVQILLPTLHVVFLIELVVFVVFLRDQTNSGGWLLHSILVVLALLTTYFGFEQFMSLRIHKSNSVS